jgi:hypothetical protein
MKKKSKIRLVICLIVLGILIIPNIWVRVVPSRAVRALPDTVTDFHEEYSGCPCYDYSRRLEAKVSRENYRNFIRNYGQLTKYDPVAHHDFALYMKWCFPKAIRWLIEDGALKESYFFIRQDIQYVVVVGYLDGWLYFYESKC